MSVGRLELPIPELGRGTQFLSSNAEELEKRIRAAVPAQFKKSIKVQPFKRRGSSGLAVEFDDGAERFVWAAIETPEKS